LGTDRYSSHRTLLRREMDIFHQKSKEETIEASQAKHQEKEKEKPEQQWEEKRAAEKIVEFETMQEQVSKTGPSQPISDPSKVLKDLSSDTNLQPKKAEPEPLAETTDVPKKDLDWVEKVEEVIKKDKDKPYQEEEDAETLQQDYLKNSFKEDVKIDE